MEQVDLNHLSDVVRDNIDLFLDHFGIDSSYEYEKVVCQCPIHDDADNPTGFCYYRNTGIWFCFTHQCEEIFKSTGFGLIRGLLTNRLYENEKIATVSETVTFITGLLGGKLPLAESVVTQPLSFLSPFLEPEPEQNNETSFDLSIIRSRLSIPSKYLIRRGFSSELLTQYNIGEANYGAMSGRAVIPVEKEDDGAIVGFTGRAVNGQMPKWLHHSLKKSYYLFNMFRASDSIAKTKTIVLVEGPLDALRLEEAGIHNSVAMFGANLSNEQRFLIESLGCVRKIVCITDNDIAGNTAYDKIHNKFKNLYEIKRVRITKKDVGEMPIQQIKRDVTPYV